MELEAALGRARSARAIAHPNTHTLVANVHPILGVEFIDHMSATDLVCHI
jgi:hypothetical protein